MHKTHRLNLFAGKINKTMLDYLHDGEYMTNKRHIKDVRGNRREAASICNQWG